MRVYIESTIPSYLAARPAPDIVRNAQQRMTWAWWEYQRGRYELWTSQVVLDEIALGDRLRADERLKLMADVPLLDIPDEAERLAASILESGLLPKTADRDALHIALASYYEIDVLLTWNCRHIANPDIQGALRKLAGNQGYTLSTLCTPGDFPEATP